MKKSALQALIQNYIYYSENRKESEYNEGYYFSMQDTLKKFDMLEKVHNEALKQVLKHKLDDNIEMIENCMIKQVNSTKKTGKIKAYKIDIYMLYRNIYDIEWYNLTDFEKVRLELCISSVYNAYTDYIHNNELWNNRIEEMVKAEENFENEGDC